MMSELTSQQITPEYVARCERRSVPVDEFGGKDVEPSDSSQPEIRVPQGERLAYNQKEAAALLGMSVTTLWKEEKLGKIRKTSRGLYPRAELERYLRDELAANESSPWRRGRAGRPPKAGMS